MAQQKLEKEITKEVMRLATERANDLHVPFLIRKRHVTMGVTGDPDLYGSIDGRHFEVEMKRPGEHPTPLQAHRLGEWARADAITGCAHSWEEFAAIVGWSL